MPAQWYATGRIYFGEVLAYNTGDTVHESVVAAHDLIALGAVSALRPDDSAADFVVYPHVDSVPIGGNSGVTDQQVTTAIATAIASHKADPIPHIAYDDLPSLTVLFENRLA